MKLILAKALSLLLAVSLMTACAGKNPANTIADMGAQITPIAMQLQLTVQKADETGLQPNKELTGQAQVQFRNLGETLQKLAAALTAYKTLDGGGQERESERLRQLIEEARRITRSIMTFTGGNSALTEQLERSFTNLDRVFDVVITGLKPLPAVQ